MTFPISLSLLGAIYDATRKTQHSLLLEHWRMCDCCVEAGSAAEHLHNAKSTGVLHDINCTQYYMIVGALVTWAIYTQEQLLL